jgi:hypothetical protein
MDQKIWPRRFNYPLCHIMGVTGPCSGTFCRKSNRRPPFTSFRGPCDWLKTHVRRSDEKIWSTSGIPYVKNDQSPIKLSLMPQT